MNELTYDQVVERMNAAGVPVGARRIREVMHEHQKICPPIRYGYRTIRFAVAGVDAVIAKIKARAVQAGNAAAGLPPGDTAKSRRDKLPKKRKAKR